MLEHARIKIEDEEMEIEEEKITNYNKGQLMQVQHKVTTAEEDELDDKSSITKIEVAENCLENTKESEDGILRQTNSINTTKASIKADIKICDNNCAFYEQQELLFQCKFCDKNYDDKENFKRHVLDEHKMDVPVPNGIGLHKEKSVAADPVSCIGEPFDSCANFFILNHLYLICRHCECEFASIDLFEIHLREEHQILERPQIKTETSTEINNQQDLLKPAKEVVIETFEPKATKRSVTKRKCTIKNDINQQEDHEITEIKTEPGVLEKTPKVAKIKPIALEKLSYGNRINEDRIQEEAISKEFHNEVIKVEKLSSSINEKKYKCTLCELSFSGQKELISHTRHHSSDCRFKCTQCPKGFKRNSELLIHIRIHTGEKSFVCDICNKSFRANQNLSIHKKIHMGEECKTYKCNYCEKKFKRNMELRIHYRTHNGVKPFKCEICDRGYSSKFNLQSHIERDHEGKKTYKEPTTTYLLKKEIDRQKKMIEELQKQLLERSKANEAKKATT